MSTPYTDQTLRSNLATSFAPLCALVGLAAVATAQGCRPLTTAYPPQANRIAGEIPDTAEAVLPGEAPLPAPGPYLIHRVASTSGEGATGVTDLAVRLADGTLAATWRLPDGGRIHRLSDAVSPDGRWLAYLTGDSPDWHMTPMTVPLTLHVWDLRDGNEVFVHPVVRDLDAIYDALRVQGREQSKGYGDNPAYYISMGQPVPTPDPTSIAMNVAMANEDVACAFSAGLGHIAWSPDAQHLAFGGALDGPSGDVYIVDVGNWSLRRVSSEPTHVVGLTWSPDSRWIVHEGSGFCGRASGGVDPSTTDVSSVDGASERHIFGPGYASDWGGAWPDAWIGTQEVLLHKGANGRGEYDITRIDVRTGISRTFVAGLSAGGVIAVPGGRHIATGATIYHGTKQDNVEESGVFIVDTDSGAYTRVWDEVCRVAYWGTADRPFARLPGYGLDECSAAAFGLDKVDVPLESAGTWATVSVSPNRVWRVLYGEQGWRLYDAQSTLRGSWPNNKVTAVRWRPDDVGLFWTVGQQFMYANVLDGEARAVGTLADQEWNPFDVAWLAVTTQ